MHDGVVVMMLVEQGVQGAVLVQHQVDEEEEDIVDENAPKHLQKQHQSSHKNCKTA